MNNFNASLRIGWGRQSITPQKPAALFGQFYERISERVRDELFVTALAIEDSDGGGGGPAGDGSACGGPVCDGPAGDHCIMISCDLLWIHGALQSGVRRALAGRLKGVDPEKVLLFAIHTHTAPYYAGDANFRPILCPYLGLGGDICNPDEYFNYLVDKICLAAEEAWLNRRAGYARAAEQPAITGFCRMAVYRDGGVRMYGDTDTADFRGLLGAGYPYINMLFFYDQQRKLTGVFVNAPCPPQIVEHKSYVSADFWSQVRKDVGEALGPGIYILPAMGAAGDQSPRDLLKLTKDDAVSANESFLNSHIPVSDTSRDGWEMYDEAGLISMGRKIAAHIADAYRDLELSNRPEPGRPAFKHICRKIGLPLMRVTGREYADALAECAAAFNISSADEDVDMDARFVALSSRMREAVFTSYGIVKRYKYQQSADLYKTEIHALRIGDCAVVTNPFELYSEYGLRIRARSRIKRLIITDLACDNGGYLPVKKAVKGKAYSAIAACCNVGPQAGDLLVSHVADMLDELYGRRE